MKLIEFNECVCAGWMNEWIRIAPIRQSPSSEARILGQLLWCCFCIRYGLECVNYGTSDQLTTDARQSSDMSNTTTDCPMNNCSLATYDSTTSSNLTSSTSEASGITFTLRLYFAMYTIALVNLLYMLWPDSRVELFLAWQATKHGTIKETRSVAVAKEATRTVRRIR